MKNSISSLLEPGTLHHTFIHVNCLVLNKILFKAKNHLRIYLLHFDLSELKAALKYPMLYEIDNLLPEFVSINIYIYISLNMAQLFKTNEVVS